jgi:hypothetical protein
MSCCFSDDCCVCKLFLCSIVVVVVHQLRLLSFVYPAIGEQRCRLDQIIPYRYSRVISDGINYL